MSLPSAYRPSPLSYGSPRTSPFRRPESPASPFRRPESPSSPSTTIRPTTPTTPLASPTKQHNTPIISPSKLQTSSTSTSNENFWTPRGLAPSFTPSTREPPISPTRSSSAATVIPFGRSQMMNNNPLTTLPPAQIRSMREAFSLLDRSSSNQITRDDVTDMLINLSLPSGASEITPFFPPGAPQTLPLPTFLSTLSSLLAPLSSQEELLNAFAAFDERDSGEIDVSELRDAVLHTAPEPGECSLSVREVEEALGGFVGRKAFGKELKGSASMGRGEVFRYREWVGGVMGAGDEKGEGEK